MQTDRILIKRYGRSRFYIPAEGRFVTLEDLRRWEREDVPFRVEDTETGEEITRVLLA